MLPTATSPSTTEPSHSWFFPDPTPAPTTPAPPEPPEVFQPVQIVPAVTEKTVRLNITLDPVVVRQPVEIEKVQPVIVAGPPEVVTGPLPPMLAGEAPPATVNGTPQARASLSLSLLGPADGCFYREGPGTGTHSHARMHACMHVHMHAHPLMRTQAHVHARTHRKVCVRAFACARLHAHERAYMHLHMHAHIHTRAQCTYTQSVRVRSRSARDRLTAKPYAALPWLGRFTHGSAYRSLGAPTASLCARRGQDVARLFQGLSPRLGAPPMLPAPIGAEERCWVALLADWLVRIAGLLCCCRALMQRRAGGIQAVCRQIITDWRDCACRRSTRTVWTLRNSMSQKRARQRQRRDQAPWRHAVARGYDGAAPRFRADSGQKRLAPGRSDTCTLMTGRLTIMTQQVAVIRRREG